MIFLCNSFCSLCFIRFRCSVKLIKVEQGTGGYHMEVFDQTKFEALQGESWVMLGVRSDCF